MGLFENLEAPPKRPDPYFERSWDEFMEPDPRGPVLIPEGYFERHELTAIGKVQISKVNIDDHQGIKMWLVRFPKRERVARLNTLRQIVESRFPSTHALLVSEGRVKDRIYPVILTPYFRVIFDYESDVIPPELQQKKELCEEVVHIAESEYVPHFARLARLMGRHVRYHLYGADGVSPYTTHPEDIHLISGVSPPGCSGGSSQVMFICGHRATVNGDSVTLSEYAVDRGKLVQDPYHERPIVQVLGNTWYLLFSILGTMNRSTSGLIVKHALALARDAHVQKEEGRSVMSASAFMEARAEVFRVIPNVMQSNIESVRARIDDAQSTLTKEMGNLMMYQRALRDLRGGEPDEQDIHVFREEWVRLHSHTCIARVLRGTGYALIIETTPIVLFHNGQGFDIGPLFVRIDFMEAKVGIWSEQSLHPRGIAHPHVIPNGTPCYGNASVAISEALGQFRVADTVELILRWLHQGYDPDLTLHKIEEWPTSISKEGK